MKNNMLLQTIPEGPLAIIGDIHGEIDALDALLDRLETDPGPPRQLVFIGDLCDRGPDSIAVIQRVRELVDQGKAWMILGNHEINLLADDAKDGSGWYFPQRAQPDQAFYAPFQLATQAQRTDIRAFFAEQPLVLQSPSLRLVHAAWDPPSIQAIAQIRRGQLDATLRMWDDQIREAALRDDLLARYQYEMEHWARQIEDPNDPPPYLHAVADYETLEQRLSPVKRLTSGIEARSPEPFYSGNRWRYSDRIPWWEDYTDNVPVVIGHYWRMFNLPSRERASRYSLLFEGIAPTAWHGRNQGVFCVDYSVGARWRERKAYGHLAEPSRFRLAALYWPERTLIFDNGERYSTLNIAS